MLALYNTVTRVAKPFALLYAAWRRRHPEQRLEWSQRVARDLPAAPPNGVWLHGASVGEARLVGSLAAALRGRWPDRPLVVSAMTAGGYERLPAPPLADARFFLPLDLPGFAERLLAGLRPQRAVFVETELWPNTLRAGFRAGVPVALVNARLAPERMARYRRFAGLYRPLIARLHPIVAQSEADAERFRTLGARPESVVVGGNLKYDLPAPRVAGAPLRNRFGARPVVVAGSTRPGEETIVLEAFTRLRRSFPDVGLLLAPRHVERAMEVADLAAESGLAVERWSEEGRATAPDVVVLDTLGRLAGLYGEARLAFVGGSLRPFGGHSPLEPAAAGVPVLFGPHMQHFEETAAGLLACGGAKGVTDAVDLCAAASVWLADESLRARAARAAAGLVESNRGALERTLAALEAPSEAGAA